MSADYGFGDVLPLPADVDLTHAAAIQRRRGAIVRNAASGVPTPWARAARMILDGHAARAAREADPLERAKTFLRRRGFAPVAQVGANIFMVGTLRFASAGAVMAFAETKGWTR